MCVGQLGGEREKEGEREGGGSEMSLPKYWSGFLIGDSYYGERRRKGDVIEREA